MEAPIFPKRGARVVAKQELGLKRICGNCGTKFYDLARDPIVCPKCGTTYVPTAASARASARAEPVAAVVADEPELAVPAGAEVISLEEADAEASGKKKVPATAEAEGDEEVEVAAAEEDDTFLEAEEEESGDVSDIIGEKLEEDEES
jgi:uncharacterized protein (TIGR02300 family)